MTFSPFLGLLALLLFGHAATAAVEFSGTWEQEWAYATEEEEAQKFEALIEPRWDLSFRGDLHLTMIGRIRLDGLGEIGPEQSRPDTFSEFNGPLHNNAHLEVSLREFYLDADWGGSFWRLGKQQVVWGQADGIKVLDVLNPQSMREFIVDEFDDSRIPLWMLNVQAPVGEDSTLQLVWIPDNTYMELAEEGTPYFTSSPRLVPRAPAGIEVRVERFDKPDDFFADSDIGARYSTFVNGWDLTLNYLFHYQDLPVLYQELLVSEQGLAAVVSPGYERNHLIGGTLGSVVGDATVRLELAYNTDTYHLSSDITRQGIAQSAEIASVVGLDWQLGANGLLSGQWFQSSLPDHDNDVLRDKMEQHLSLLYKKSFRNETWDLTALSVYSINHQDSWVQLKFQHVLRSNLEIWLGADMFQGDRDGLFGQFSRQDRVLLGFKLGF